MVLNNITSLLVPTHTNIAILSNLFRHECGQYAMYLIPISYNCSKIVEYYSSALYFSLDQTYN